MASPRFRPNVGAILRRDDGQMLIAERGDRPGCWQFPQGGVKRGETAREGLARELVEEIGLLPSQYLITAEKGPYRYLFPAGRKKEGFDGQEQTYFLLRLLDPAFVFQLGTSSAEFRATRWIQPESFQIAWIPDFKQEVYQRVFADLLQTKL